MDNGIQLRYGGHMWLIAVLDTVAIVALHRLGPGPPWDDLVGWMSRTTPDEVLAQALRLVALGLGYWVAVSWCLAVILALRPQRRSAPLLRRLTVPFLRPLLGRALIVAMAATPATVPMAWASPSSLSRPVEILPPYIPTPAGFPSDDGDSVAGAPWKRLPRPSPQHVEPSTYVVVKGDNLWKIACMQISNEHPDPTSGEIVPYWLELIDLNRDRLRSGDPDLIYPGEELLLPDL